MNLQEVLHGEWSERHMCIGCPRICERIQVPNDHMVQPDVFV